jgi:hypothetical protein
MIARNTCSPSREIVAHHQRNAHSTGEVIQKRRASNGFGDIGSEEPLIVVGAGSAVSPLNFCLSAQGYRQDRSDDRATLDGLKRSRLSSDLV